jgi:hypothetical protein
VAWASGAGEPVPPATPRRHGPAGDQFRRDGDALVGLKVLGAGEELLFGE